MKTYYREHISESTTLCTTQQAITVFVFCKRLKKKLLKDTLLMSHLFYSNRFLQLFTYFLETNTSLKNIIYAAKSRLHLCFSHEDYSIASWKKLCASQSLCNVRLIESTAEKEGEKKRSSKSNNWRFLIIFENWHRVMSRRDLMLQVIFFHCWLAKCKEDPAP